MVFTTLPFIIFFAVVFFGYYALPSRYRWWLLLAASWFFYAYMTPYYLIFLAIATGVTYFAAIGIDNNLKRQKTWISVNGKSVGREAKKSYKAGMERKRNQVVALTVVALIGMLVAFKYLDFLFANVSWFGGVLGFDFSLTPLHLILPIGLSFYVFQSLGYCIDVSREMMPAERNFFRHALFVSYFPQVLQGPIGDYGRLAPQLFADKQFDYQGAVFGLQRIAWGFFKKLVVANAIAKTTNPLWCSVETHQGMLLWLFLLSLYSIQLYADFSGYMDIACGCSQMLGIKLDENFKCPYFSKSIADFWRNWHITLGVWFKNYVFYPLLRSDCLAAVRKCCRGHDLLASILPTVAALAIVWFLIGLWHGAEWKYVIYGFYHGSFIILAVVLQPVYNLMQKRCPWMQTRVYSAFTIVRTFIIVTLGYAIFRADNLADTCVIAQNILSGFGFRELLWFVNSNWAMVVTFPIGIIPLVSVDVWHYCHEGKSLRVLISRWPAVNRYACYLIFLLSLIFWGIYSEPALNQFAYFKF